MPLKLTKATKTGELVFTWTADDGSFDATWRVKAESEEDEILDTLTKVVRFVRTQRAETIAQVQEIEDFLRTDSEGEWKTAPTVPAEAERIPMGPPRASDLPSDGGPVNGWAVMASRPQIPATSANGPMGWEYIPPGE